MKVLFLAFLLVSCACAGTITTKSCGTNAILCSVQTGTQNGFPTASIALAISPGSSPDATASVSIQEDFQVLITGGSGGALLKPSLQAVGNGYASSSVSATISGKTSWSAGGSSVTGSFSSSTLSQSPFQFTFGVPFELDLAESLSATASSSGGLLGQSNAAVNSYGLVLTNLAGAPIQADVSVVEIVTPTPEPGSFWLLLGAFCVGAVVIRGTSGTVRYVTKWIHCSACRVVL
ncbi:MAG: hypothetical protein WBW33_15355 [Bryobacteraceae bacterium]